MKKNTPRRASTYQRTNTTITNSMQVSRSFIANESIKRRDIKFVRSLQHQEECADILFNFLSNKNYENLNNNLLRSPSSKEFKDIFIFIVEQISRFSFNRFEEDVLNILRQLKYPYISEINRSQIKVVAPHSWPVLLSMLSWLADLIDNIKMEENREEFDVIFENYTFKCYKTFMEGGDEYERETEELENEIEKLHKIKMAEIEKLKGEKIVIDEALQTIKYNDNTDIKNSNEEVKKQLDKLKRTVEKIPQKLESFTKTAESAKREIFELNVEKLQKRRDKLQEQINNQTIKPEEIIEINKIKEELNERIKEIKKRKEKLSRENIKNEQEIFDHQSERDALCHEISILNTSDNLIDSFEEIEKIKNLRLAIENEICDLKKSILEYEDKIIFYQQKNKDTHFEFENLKNEAELLNTKLLALGKLYLEKRSQFENEIFKFKKEIENLNGKILQMELDSRYSLLNLEEQLETSRITYDSLKQKLKEEEREMEKFLSKILLEIEMKFEELDLLEQTI